MTTAREFSGECRRQAKALRRLSPEVKRALRERVRPEVAEPLAGEIRSAGTGVYSRRAAATARSRSGADPTIVVGSSSPAFSGGASTRDVVFGAEFSGGSRITAVTSPRARRHLRRSTRQFIRQESFVFPTVARSIDRTFDRWASIVDDVVTQEVTNGR